MAPLMRWLTANALLGAIAICSAPSAGSAARATSSRQRVGAARGNDGDAARPSEVDRLERRLRKTKAERESEGMRRRGKTQRRELRAWASHRVGTSMDVVRRVLGFVPRPVQVAWSPGGSMTSIWSRGGARLRLSHPCGSTVHVLRFLRKGSTLLGVDHAGSGAIWSTITGRLVQEVRFGQRPAPWTFDLQVFIGCLAGI